MTELVKSAGDLKPGDILARPVVLPTGKVLYHEGIELDSDSIREIARWKIAMIPVRSAGPRPDEERRTESEARAREIALGDTFEHGEREFQKRRPGRAEWSPPPFRYDRKVVGEAKKVADEVHRRAIVETSLALKNLSRRQSGSIEPLKNQIVDLTDEGLRNPQVLAALAALAEYDDALLRHTINSTVYAILVGQAMGFGKTELAELAESALLHDIGMSEISAAIWKKPDRLTEEEMWAVRRHTFLGADIVSNTEGAAYVSQVVAYQHHERWDGSGYPKGRSETAINEFARIVGMVDVFTAMTSPRSYRDRLLGYDAMNFILTHSSTLFDPRAVKAFLSAISLYPIGSLVELSTGAHGIVVAANPMLPHRPQVKVKRDAAGKDAGDAGDVIDLLTAHEISIVKALSPKTEGGPEELWKAF